MNISTQMLSVTLFIINMVILILFHESSGLIYKYNRSKHQSIADIVGVVICHRIFKTKFDKGKILAVCVLRCGGSLALFLYLNKKI
jgi:hypothetical protein